LDALREKPHPTHFSIAEAVDAARRIRARRTCFTHMTHDLRHEPTCARLPDTMQLAYDGLVVEL
jgi:phosphoribosyl 1,2-cyclic phosphate phosphodiesterase